MLIRNRPGTFSELPQPPPYWNEYLMQSHSTDLEKQKKKIFVQEILHKMLKLTILLVLVQNWTRLLLSLARVAMSQGINKITADRNQRALIELVQAPGNGERHKGT